MTDNPQPARIQPARSICGLALALFAIPLVTLLYRLVVGVTRSNEQLLAREVVIFGCAALLVWWVREREGLPLASVGLQAGRPVRALLRGGALALILLASTVGLYLLLQRVGIHLGDSDRGTFRPSLWVATVISVRAGMVEELFYRGYAIERLRALTGNAALAALVPLLVFAAVHYRQGAGGIIVAFVLGGVLTLFYLRFHDLLANIVGHTLTDLVLNVVLPLMG
jgi:membrane protease YdiL (CAAX protease family)